MFDVETEFALQSAAQTSVAPSHLPLYRHRGKRLFDLVFVAAISPVLVPLVALLALVIRLDGGAIFFAHDRVGQGGRSFRCWKLRTMVPDAEDRLRAYLQGDNEARVQWQAHFKLVDDPRITAIGRVLRKTSLDELPQFWNVIRGDMSVVGPRPITAAEVAMYYGAAAKDVHSVRPGVTGIWQVSGRNTMPYASRVAMDKNYVARISLLGDLAIIAKTVAAVVRRTGC